MRSKDEIHISEKAACRLVDCPCLLWKQWQLYSFVRIAGPDLVDVCLPERMACIDQGEVLDCFELIGKLVDILAGRRIIHHSQIVSIFRAFLQLRS